MINVNLIDLESYRKDFSALLESKEDYYEVVRALTERNYDLFKNRINPKNLKRGWRNNHVDHVYSVSQGFKDQVNPFHIAHPCNLQMLKARQNKLKNSACGHTLAELESKISDFGEV